LQAIQVCEISLSRDYLGVSFNSLVVAGVLGLILAVPLSVKT
jgi:hypothetical protein